MPLPPMPAAPTAQAAAPSPADAPLRWHAPQATTPAAAPPPAPPAAAATRGEPSWPSPPTTTSANLTANHGRMVPWKKHHHTVACSQCSSPAPEARAVCNGAAYTGARINHPAPAAHGFGLQGFLVSAKVFWSKQPTVAHLGQPNFWQLVGGQY